MWWWGVLLAPGPAFVTFASWSSILWSKMDYFPFPSCNSMETSYNWLFAHRKPCD